MEKIMSKSDKLLVASLRSKKEAERNGAIKRFIQLKERGLPLLLQALNEEVSDKKGNAGENTNIRQIHTKVLNVTFVFVPPEDEFSGDIIQNIKILIGQIGNPALSPICNLLQSEIKGNPNLLLALIDILRKIGNKEATPSLLSLLSHQDLMIQWHVVLALEQLKDKRALSKLKDLLEDKKTNSFVHNEIEIAIRYISAGR
jgi:HEAT repeat protein